MKQNIQVKIKYSDGKVISKYVTSFDIPFSATCSEVKNSIKPKINDVKLLDVQNDILYFGNKKLEDNDIVNLSSGLEYEIIVEKKNLNSDNKLGRKHIKDDRDLNYLISNHLPLMVPQITQKYWDNSVWIGNQGNTPQCVGYAWAHWIEDGPILHEGVHPVVNPTTIYTEAQKVDEWMGENYDGTSVRGGAKYLKNTGKISSYLWAFDLTTLINTVLTKGPVVVGTNWYTNMFYPDRNGLIRIGGRLAGGHAYDINGVDTIKKQFRIKNSWGKSWGIQGHAYISFSDMTRLIRENGEICLAVENTF